MPKCRGCQTKWVFPKSRSNIIKPKMPGKSIQKKFWEILREARRVWKHFPTSKIPQLNAAVGRERCLSSHAQSVPGNYFIVLVKTQNVKVIFIPCMSTMSVMIKTVKKNVANYSIFAIIDTNQGLFRSVCFQTNVTVLLCISYQQYSPSKGRCPPKNGKMWEFSHVGDLPPPPRLGMSCFWEKNYGLFCILGP